MRDALSQLLTKDSRGTLVLFDRNTGPSVQSNVRLDYAQIATTNFAGSPNDIFFVDEALIDGNWWLIPDRDYREAVSVLPEWPIGGFISEHWISAQEEKPNWILMTFEDNVVKGPIGFPSRERALASIMNLEAPNLRREFSHQGMYRIWDSTHQPQMLVGVIFPL